MSNRNHIIKRYLKQIRKHDQKHYLYQDYQPHKNDRWRAIRNSLSLPAEVTLSGIGEYSFWSTPFINPELQKRLQFDRKLRGLDDPNNPLIKKRQQELEKHWNAVPHLNCLN